jgi:hypothetical protein
MIVVEALKHRFNHGRRANLSFYRDSGGTEVDLFYGLAEKVVSIEIKSGETVSSSFFANLRKVRDYLPDRVAGEILVHGSESEAQRNGVWVTGAAGFVPRLASLEREFMG